MTRKLHNTLLALSLSGLTLVMALFAAASATLDVGDDAALATIPEARMGEQYAVERSPETPAEIAAVARQAGAIDGRARDLEVRIEQRTRVFEAAMARSQDADVGATIANAIAFAAEVSTEAALGAALQATDEHRGVTHVPTEAQQRQRHARRIRGALAVPYFSFAQGLRHGNGS